MAMLAVMMINSVFVSPDPIQSSSCPPLPALGRARACVGLDAVAEQQVWHQAASKRPVFIYSGSLVFSSGGAYKQDQAAHTGWVSAGIATNHLEH